MKFVTRPLKQGLRRLFQKKMMEKFETFLNEFLKLNGLLYTPEQFANWEQKVRDDEREKVNKENKKALYKYCQTWK